MTMKKIGIIILAAVLLCLTGCGKEDAGAKEVVKSYCNAMKKLDIAEMESYVEYGTDFGQFTEWTQSETFEPLIEQVREITLKTKVNIKDVDMDEDGESGMVTVEFKYIDLSEAGVKALWNSVVDGITLALGGANDKEAYIKLIANSFKEVVKDMDKTKNTVTAVFHVEKVDDEWKIVQNPSEIPEVAFCNVLGFFDSVKEELLSK